MGYKTTTGAVPQPPATGGLILSWASQITRYLKGTRLIFGNAFTVNPGPNGTMVDYLPPGGFDSFKVYRASDGAISIRGGYAQTQAGTLTAVAAVSTVAVSADMAVFARYDLGLAGTSSPGWEVVSGSIIQTAAALPSYDARYRVVPIAAVTWDGTSSAISGIVQHHIGNLECPDRVESGTVQPFNVPYGTVKYGWKPCDGTASTVDTQKKLISGKGSTGNLAAGSETADVTAAALNAAQTAHGHGLPTASGYTAQEYISGTIINVENLDDTVTSNETAVFSTDIEVDIIPPNVALAFYEHL